jgi:hypothetical protein
LPRSFVPSILISLFPCASSPVYYYSLHYHTCFPHLYCSSVFIWLYNA